MKDFNVNPYVYNTSSTPTKKEQVVYSDISLNLDFNPGTKDITRLLEEESIKNSLRNLLKTSRYERVYNPLYGGSLNQILFEQIDDRNILAVDTIVRTAIENYEPRVQVLDVVSTGLVDENTLAMTLLYTIINRQGQQRLDLQITRVR